MFYGCKEYGYVDAENDAGRSCSNESCQYKARIENYKCGYLRKDLPSVFEGEEPIKIQQTLGAANERTNG